ncbi:MAG: hypothetical protein ACREXI_02170 [Caldimonas sp.]
MKVAAVAITGRDDGLGTLPPAEGYAGGVTCCSQSLRDIEFDLED